MFFIKIIMFCFIATLLLFILFRKNIIYKDAIHNLFKKNILTIIGIINICIIIIFVIWYIINYILNTDVNEIKSIIQIISMIAFLVVLFPLSISSIIMSIILDFNKLIEKKIFYYGLILNTLASISSFFVVYQQMKILSKFF
jgi:hypothetical protein